MFIRKSFSLTCDVCYNYVLLCHGLHFYKGIKDGHSTVHLVDCGLDEEQIENIKSTYCDVGINFLEEKVSEENIQTVTEEMWHCILGKNEA